MKILEKVFEFSLLMLVILYFAIMSFILSVGIVFFLWLIWTLSHILINGQV